jgi:hypothetical protein
VVVTTDESAGSAVVDRPRLPPFASRVTGALVAVAVVLAAYTGFRVPNLWSVTLMSVSITDGFHRRFLVGTLLRPLAESRNFSYWWYAAAAFAILVALLAVLVVAALRTQMLSQRFLVIAFLLLPTGGYLFQEVGYLDQLIYLFLFVALIVIDRRVWWIGPVVMTLAVVTHELALITAIPVFAFVVIRRYSPTRALIALAPPAVVGIVVLVVPGAASGAIPDFERRVAGANWQPRADALSLFGRTQSESLDLYDPREVFYFLIPLIIVGVVGFLLVYRADRRREPAPVLAEWARGYPWLYPTLAVLAIVSPALLIWAGWDKWRWGFLLLANFFLVTWIWLGERGRELDTVQFVTLAAVLLVTVHVSLLYFDLYEPRDLSAEDWREFRAQIEDGSLVEIPER